MRSRPSAQRSLLEIGGWNLDLKHGRMGPSSSPSDSGGSPRQEEADELQGLPPAEEGELQEEVVQEEPQEDVGELTRFEELSPKPHPPHRDGPTGKEWTRVDLIE